MKKTLVYLVVACFLAICPILIFWAVYARTLDKKSYNFTRRFVYPIYRTSAIDVKLKTYYIAGMYNKNFYLGTADAPSYLLQVGKLILDTQFVKINIKTADFSQTGVYRTIITNGKFHMFNGITRSNLVGEAGKWVASRQSIFSPFFQQAMPISDQSLIYKYVSSKTKGNSLRKETIAKKHIENDEVLEKQVDGLFCTSGSLKYNKSIHTLIYIYTYRNEVLLLDTNLNLINKFRTIDPIDSAKFTVSQIKANKSSVITSPSVLVNATFSSSKNLLFVNSAVMGKGEDLVKFENSSVIDVYNLSSRKYLYSFYIPKQDKYPIRQFEVYGDELYALAGNHLLKYILKLP